MLGKDEGITFSNRGLENVTKKIPQNCKKQDSPKKFLSPFIWVGAKIVNLSFKGRCCSHNLLH